ncbi:hypothetical protein [Streptacidiphilus sp. EB103A]|uniref:hypothetical protein n=1 Tax=Streptacidiphilus sp. EB103A TaxID=3156275 RepID=UPI0035183C7D
MCSQCRIDTARYDTDAEDRCPQYREVVAREQAAADAWWASPAGQAQAADDARADLEAEDHIARNYGDCGQSLHQYFTPEEGGY